MEIEKKSLVREVVEYTFMWFSCKEWRKLKKKKFENTLIRTIIF